jgi:hypothetical protein
MKPKATKREDRRMIRHQSAWIMLNGVASFELAFIREDQSAKPAK